MRIYRAALQYFKTCKVHTIMTLTTNQTHLQTSQVTAHSGLMTGTLTERSDDRHNKHTDKEYILNTSI